MSLWESFYIKDSLAVFPQVARVSSKKFSRKGLERAIFNAVDS